MRGPEIKYTISLKARLLKFTHHTVLANYKFHRSPPPSVTRRGRAERAEVEVRLSIPL